jgi:hypothetical protein
MNRTGNGLEGEGTLRLLIEAPHVPEQHERWLPLVGVLSHVAHIQEIRPRNLDIWWTHSTERRTADWVGRSAAGSDEAPSRSPAVLVVHVEPEPDIDAEVGPWYDDEHLPSLRRVPGVLAAARFVSIDDPPSHLVVYRLASPSVVVSAEWAQAADSPKTRSLRSRWRHAWRVLALAPVQSEDPQ